MGKGQKYFKRKRGSAQRHVRLTDRAVQWGKTSVPFGSIQEVENGTKRRDAGLPHSCFFIRTKARVYEFEAFDARTALRWVGAIKYVCGLG